MPRVIDLTGKKFNRLTVLQRTGTSNDGQALWECLCDCGNKKTVRSYCLTKGNTQSCGCFHREQSKKNHTTHGMSKTKIYRIWGGILTRCSNKNNRAYKYYGARGIRVCKRWLKFENFYKDMGDPPKGLTLERINNEGDYKPSNCKWATWIEQKRNTRGVKLSVNIALIIRQTKRSVENIKLLALKYSVSECTIYDILNHRTWI